MKSQSGQTLIEVIIAAGLVVLVLTTLVSGISIGVRNSRIAKDQATAKEYVRESLESLRNLRDQAGWETFYAISKTGNPYCMKTLPADYKAFANLTNTACGTNVNNMISGQFYRQIQITKPTASSIQAVATVTWNDGSRVLKSESTVTLYQWK